MLSLLLKRYYGLLRLPYLPPAISVFLICSRCSYWWSTDTDLPPCTINLPLHTIPATPGDLMIRFRCLESSTTAFPLCPQGQHLHFKLTRLHIGSLALRSAVLPRGNLQPLITQTLLPWGLIRRCTNNSSYGTLTRLDLSPITAYGHDT